MKFADFPMEQVALQIYEGLDLILVDLINDCYPIVYVYPCFFDRLIKAVEYAGLDSSLISGMNLNNCSEYHSEVSKLEEEVYNKFNIDIIKQDYELCGKYWQVDILGYCVSDLTPIDLEY